MSVWTGLRGEIAWPWRTVRPCPGLFRTCDILGVFVNFAEVLPTVIETPRDDVGELENRSIRVCVSYVHDVCV